MSSTASLPRRSLGVGSPVAGALRRIGNPFVRAVLRSRFHRLLSGSLLLLTVHGRHTGRAYTFPVQFVQDGASLYVVPGDHRHKNWWRNLMMPSPVEVRLRGARRRGTAQACFAEDVPDIVTTGMRRYLEKFRSVARQDGLEVVDGRVLADDEQLRKAVSDEVVVRIDLSND